MVKVVIKSLNRIEIEIFEKLDFILFYNRIQFKPFFRDSA